MSAFILSDLAASLDARLEGDPTIKILGAAEPAMARAQDLALAMDPKYAEMLEQGKARAAVLWEGADWRALGLEAAIFVPRPRYAMSGITRALDHGPDIASGIHPSAVVDGSAKIGDGASIGPLVVIGADVRVGTNARIASHVSLDSGSSVGDNALILQGVRIGAQVVIGDNFIVQPNAVIGGDGFSFVTPEKSTVESARENLGQTASANQSWTRIHSLGSVTVGDDVEIGSGACIDRGTIRDTKIGRGTKLDNMVHLGHNVEVGEDCLLCGQVGIAGSTKVGNRVVMGGQCGASDNIFIGDDVVAGGASKIFTNVPAGRVILGSPAVKMETQMEMQKALRRLPRLMSQLKGNK